MTRTISTNGHTMELRNSLLGLGLERVLYDGQERSRQRATWGGIHDFTVEEDGREVRYQIVAGWDWRLWRSSPSMMVYRNGTLLPGRRQRPFPPPWQLAAVSWFVSLYGWMLLLTAAAEALDPTTRAVSAAIGWLVLTALSTPVFAALVALFTRRRQRLLRQLQGA